MWAELVPRDFPAINKEERHPTIFVLVPSNPAANNLVGYLQSEVAVFEMLD